MYWIASCDLALEILKKKQTSKMLPLPPDARQNAVIERHGQDLRAFELHSVFSHRQTKNKGKTPNSNICCITKIRITINTLSCLG